MATVSVVYDAGSAGRLNNAEATTGWTKDSLTTVQEGDFKYQGTYSVSGKLTANTESGFYYTATSTAFNSSPVKVAILKILITTKDTLGGNNIIVRIGSSTSAYYYYNSLYTSTTYPIAGGWTITPIDPNVAGYRTATGSPNLGAVTYFAFRAQCSATSKSENFAVDAIDYVTHGSGLTLTAGDGASADGTFLDFVTFDEGTSTNRYGLVRTQEGILYVFGILTIGTSTETDFTDTNRVLVFPDGRFNTGFSGLKIGLQNASSVIALASCTFIGKGRINGFGGLASGSDTRPILEVTGTSGAMTVAGCSFQSFNTITLTSGVTVTGSTFVNGVKITPDGATFDSCTFDQPDVANGTAYMDLNSGYYLDDITYSTFTSKGTGHAIELNQGGTHNLVGVEFSGYGTTGSTSAAIYNNSGTSVTIYVSEAASPTYYNGTNASTSVVQSINWYFEIRDQGGTTITSGTELRIYDDSDVLLFSADPSDGTELYSFDGNLVGTNARIVVMSTDYLYFTVTLAHPASSNTADAPVILTIVQDRVYKNPPP